MGVLLPGEVEHPVCGVQVGVASTTIGNATGPDLTEDGGQGALVAGLGAGPWHPLGVDDLGQAALLLGPGVEVPW